MGQVVLIGVCLAAFVVFAVFHQRLRAQNRRLSSALNNMSQGLNMFDAQGRITLLNTRYLQMYKLSPDVVKPGCTLKGLIEYRKQTGLFAGDVDSYVQKILDAMAQGKSQGHYVQASDGRIVLAKNEPLPAAAGFPPMKTSPSSATPSKSAPPSGVRTSGVRPSIPLLLHFGRRSRSCCPA